MTTTSKESKTARWLLAIILAFAVAVPAMPTAVSAQERVERKSLLQFLFGGGRGAQRPPAATKPAQAPRPAKPKRRAAASAAAVPPKPAIEKREDAQTVLVIGDFMADGMADGLTNLFAESPGVVIVDKSNGSSGLVRDDYFDWPAETRAIIAELKPAALVVQLGANDRQQLLVNGVREAVRSPAWNDEYARRTNAIIGIARETRVPLIWVGMPAFKSPALSADMVALNGIVRVEVEKAGGVFIDIWDGFVDEDGKFVFTGSDVNGQQVRLRGSDGINLTPAGKDKIAFYVDKALKRVLGDAPAEGVAGLGAENLPDLLMIPSPTDPVEIVRTLPVAMDDPELDGGLELLGGAAAASPVRSGPRDLLVGKGETGKAPQGRVDNFTWPPARN